MSGTEALDALMEAVTAAVIGGAAHWDKVRCEAEKDGLRIKISVGDWYDDEDDEEEA